MGNVQATASHDDNTDNNDNYVEDDIDKKDNTGPAVSSQCEIFWATDSRFCIEVRMDRLS